jgi:hypothetical protein
VRTTKGGVVKAWPAQPSAVSPTPMAITEWLLFYGGTTAGDSPSLPHASPALRRMYQCLRCHQETLEPLSTWPIVDLNVVMWHMAAYECTSNSGKILDLQKNCKVPTPSARLPWGYCPTQPMYTVKTKKLPWIPSC